MSDFCHLHCHTQYSLLDGAASIDGMLDKAKADGQMAAAITDHGNMFGAFKFVNLAKKKGIKPIIGCEVYVVEDRFRKSFEGGRRDKRYHQLLLAKNAEGYRNLCKIVSTGFTDGYYSGFPRVDKALIKQYSTGLIASSCCIGAEVPQAIMRGGEEEAEKLLLEWLDIFEDDYYIELQRHGIKDFDGNGWSQEAVNQVLISLAKKHSVPLIATNDSHYVEQEDWTAHDALLCINTGDYISTPKGRGKGFRFGFENDEFYFKTADEMKELFKDVPEAIENTVKLMESVEEIDLEREILLPHFPMPTEYSNQDDYLRHLTYEGAKHRYGEITEVVRERLDLELGVIKDMGFPGYFLIVQDFIAEAKRMGVSVGPGRGSAAGSAVAFCTGITNLDPIKYKLLFERFLNPERISMPDIDIDFDDDGRQKVIDWVVDKYGQNQVAQIVTFGSMAAKSSIRDVGRVLEFPLSETDKLAKLVPEKQGKVSLQEAFDESPDLKRYFDDKKSGESKVLDLALKLEGSVRNRGTHAAGVIIAPDDITNYIPVCVSKDSELCITQFDGDWIEKAGMLKMDFLGLKTLSIIKDAVENVKVTKGIEINVDEIPLDDRKTLELYQRGDTIGTFQFESGPMRAYLRDLKPSRFEDLIAMNALFRPGPMDNIPSYIERRHGREEVLYPHELLEDILEPTYGIMVYQEQIMECARRIAGYSLGGADVLRRVMGKKKVEEMAKHEKIFIDGAQENGLDEKKAKSIFNTIAKFASYGFNRSHSAAYAYVAFQTAYLKAHHPAEYMAAVLSRNMKDIKQVNFFMSETKKMGIEILVPDVNESRSRFVVNGKGQIRFGLAAIKGVGASAVDEIVEQRTEDGAYESLPDLCSRVNLRAVNKKTLENMALAGAYDSLGLGKRSQYLELSTDGTTFVDRSIRYGNQLQASNANTQASLFGEEVMNDTVQPEMPECEPWPWLEVLIKEKEVSGVYLSGHPLDPYRLDIQHFTNVQVEHIERYKDRDLLFAGIVSGVNKRMTKRGDYMASFYIEDLIGKEEFLLFGKDYVEFNKYLIDGQCLFVQGRYQRRFRGSDRYSFQFQSMELLSHAREKFTNDILLSLEVESVGIGLLDKLEKVLAESPGSTPVRFRIKDKEDRMVLNMHSKKYMISPSNAVLETLGSFEGIGVSMTGKLAVN